MNQRPEIIETVIVPALREFSRSKNLGIAEDTKVFGAGGLLDSINFVGFLMELEARLKPHSNKPIRMLDNKAFARKDNPFSTVGSLASYIFDLLTEAAHE